MKYTAPTSLPKHCLAEVCQNCQSHRNKPSRCTYNGQTETYVGRKTIACPDFLNKHTGQGKA